MIHAVLIVFSLMMLASALAAVLLKDVTGSIIAAGVVSLLASVLYLIYGAPDVAMTEAAIGSALTTVVFLIVWGRIKGGEVDQPANRGARND
ncbi:hydrogenase subunit MbhD domain-containing protein [Marispirochaeta aestuarii]|uniref:Na(+)/H(+) antiporter subunit B n=1 Tax=Marispirochaeta aestuarii TaxID=1963862 RepID=UPI0029C8E65C|nr:hydrogenase subunit MbhD domain-containing protein [Marispirochaeta aestuarii]